MKALKWIAIVLCAPFIAIGATYAVGSLGLLAYVGSARSVSFTERDFHVGSAYQPNERDELVAACIKRFGRNKDNASARRCDCWADTAETIASRFDRVAITALLSGSTHAVVGLGKSLINSGIPEDEVNARTQNVAVRYNRIGMTCQF